MKKIILLLCIVMGWVGIIRAQSPWLSDTRLSTVSLEWDKPLFDDRSIDRDEITTVSSVLFLTGRMRIRENFRFVAELPLSHFGYENNNPLGGDDNSTVLGNLYVGTIYDINTGNLNTHTFVELGVRIPTTPNPKTEKHFGGDTGRFAELERSEAFTSDVWGIPLIANHVTSVRGPLAVRLRLGTIYDLFIDEQEDVANQMHLLYGLTALGRQSTVEAYLGFSGRNQFMGLPSGLDFWDSGLTQIRAGIARPFRNITPGIYLRKPLGENYNRAVDLAYGFSIEIRG